jgi:hypothetical protein
MGEDIIGGDIISEEGKAAIVAGEYSMRGVVRTRV